MTTPRHQAQHCARGFTLLEVLVVLMIVSLVSVVLMQGMGLILNLRDNLGDQMIDLDRAVLKRNLVRQPLQGIVADFNDGENQFRGGDFAVKGLTIQPLFRRSGRAIPFSMTLEYVADKKINTLTYQEDADEPLVLAEWQGVQARFKYVGDTTGWAEQWPPSEAPIIMGANQMITDIRPPQLPELIFLETGSGDEIDYAVAIQTRRNRVPRDPIF